MMSTAGLRVNQGDSPNVNANAAKKSLSSCETDEEDWPAIGHFDRAQRKHPQEIDNDHNSRYHRQR